jgi:hypothetical protein
MKSEEFDDRFDAGEASSTSRTLGGVPGGNSDASTSTSLSGWSNRSTATPTFSA